MSALKQARRIIESDPNSDMAQVLAKFVLALEAEASFPLSDLYHVDLAYFELMLQMLQEWRIERYYIGKAKLFDLSMQVFERTPS